MTLLRAPSLAQPGRASDTVAEVGEILEALEARDAQRAEAAAL